MCIGIVKYFPVWGHFTLHSETSMNVFFFVLYSKYKPRPIHYGGIEVGDVYIITVHSSETHEIFRVSFH